MATPGDGPSKARLCEPEPGEPQPCESQPCEPARAKPRRAKPRRAKSAKPVLAKRNSPARIVYRPSPKAAERLQALLQVYTIDLPDPTAVEVLLVVDEVLRVLGLAMWRRRALYGERAAAFLSQWDAFLGPTPGAGPPHLTPWAGRKPRRRRAKR